MPKLKALGFETEAPRWALTLFALVLIGGVALGIYQKYYAQPEQQLVSLKDANKQLAAEVEEYSLHAMEEPEKHELFEDVDGKLQIRVFKDHCVLIQRTSARGTRSKLVIDLARAASLSAMQTEPPDGMYPSVLYVDPITSKIIPKLFAAQPPCNRGCLNPHPGQFRWWYGQRNGAWVEVWRQWPEGCQHVQMFNAQAGVWDSNPDGSARVRWTCCVH